MNQGLLLVVATDANFTTGNSLLLVHGNRVLLGDEERPQCSGCKCELGDAHATDALSMQISMHSVAHNRQNTGQL